MNPPKRYHPVLVVLHWLTVVLLLGSGFLAEDEGSSSPINIHMILGALLLLVMVVRLFVRVRTPRPAWANAGNAFFNWIGPWTHIGLYALALAILGLGGVIALRRNLFGAVLGLGLANDQGYRIITLHHLLWFLILMLLVVHVSAALYHQFILRDKLFSRMWFGR